MKFVLDFHRTKINAEARNDSHALESLRLTYPQLFTQEFLIFIEQCKCAAQHLDEKNGSQFSKIFEPDVTEEVHSELTH